MNGSGGTLLDRATISPMYMRPTTPQMLPPTCSINSAIALLSMPIPTTLGRACSPSSTTKENLRAGKEFQSLQEALSLIQNLNESQARGQRRLNFTRSQNDHQYMNPSGNVCVTCEYHPWCQFFIQIKPFLNSKRYQIETSNLYHHAQCDEVLVQPQEIPFQTPFTTPCSYPQKRFSQNQMSPVGATLTQHSIHGLYKGESHPSTPLTTPFAHSFDSSYMSLSDSNTLTPVTIQTPQSCPNSSNTLASKYAISTSMRWSTAKDAARAIYTFSLHVQKKRTRMDKKGSGGRNKKYICSHSNCDWFVRLLKVTKTDQWKISSMRLIHSSECRADFPSAPLLSGLHRSIVTFRHPEESGQFVAQTDPVSQDLDKLLRLLRTDHPGSRITTQSNEDGVLSSACIVPTWVSCMLPCLQGVFGIDILPCTLPKNQSKDAQDRFGQRHLITMIGKDGNFEPHLVAFGFIVTPDDANIQWFMRQLEKAGFLLNETAIFVDYKHFGLIRGIRHIFPEAKPLYCSESISKAIQTTLIPPLSNEMLLALEAQLQQARFAFNISSFRRALDAIADIHTGASTFLQSLDPAHWAMFACHGTRSYQWNSTCLQEYFASSVNGSSVDVNEERGADFSILTRETVPLFDIEELLLSFMHQAHLRQVDRFARIPAIEKQSKSSKHKHSNSLHFRERCKMDLDQFFQYLRLTPNALLLLQRETACASQFDVRMVELDIAFVSSRGNEENAEYRVNLLDRTCSCAFIFQIGLPCAHFLAAARATSKIPSIQLAVEPVYTMELYRMAGTIPTKAQALKMHNDAEGDDMTMNEEEIREDEYEEEEEEEERAGNKRTFDEIEVTAQIGEKKGKFEHE
uniref:AlNc14C41G3498 protein n=1 Tax=Albugo laibachii Nc14 TaxID=890382 RepID=F0W9P3_9STRA|nr:AlNc14C41G3498 [Albugo laibachii Nc14]|eukprot:CCA17861.1 AlNc14C41G3498 [Albugo laibachii Nc14]